MWLVVSLREGVTSGYLSAAACDQTSSASPPSAAPPDPPPEVRPQSVQHLLLVLSPLKQGPPQSVHGRLAGEQQHQQHCVTCGT